MYTKVVNVLSNSGTGTQDITFTPNGSDPNWTPKVAIFQWNRAVGATNTWAEHHAYGMGFTDGTNSRCVSIASEDNQARGDSARIERNNALVCALTPSGTLETVDAVATFSQWLTNGIRINWTDAPSAQFYLTILFLGGDDITNATVGTLLTGTGTGDVSVTSLAYQPDFGLFLSGLYSTENSAIATTYLSVGAATSSSAQWVQSIYSLDNPVTMTTRQSYYHNQVVMESRTILDGLASFSSFNSNGFTINISDAFTASMPIYYLVIKGGAFTVGTNTEPATTGDQTITTNTDTKAVAVFGLDTSTADSVQNDCMWSGGFADNGINQFGHVFHDTDASANSIVVSALDATVPAHVYNNITAAATPGSTTWDDYASVSSVSSTGFVLDWDAITNAGRPFRYITFGNAGAPPEQGIINETSVSVGAGSIDTTLYSTRPISAASTSVGAGAITRGKLNSRSISESSVSIGAEDIEAEREVERNISDTPPISASDSIAKTTAYSRSIDDTPTISASDSIERAIKYTKSIDESPLSISDGSIEVTKIPASTAELYNVHFVEFPEDILDSIAVQKVTGHVVASKTHKYDIIEKVTSSPKTHKYNVTQAISQVSTTKTHLYIVLNTIPSTQKTHLYDVTGLVATTKTHLYNVIGKVTTTKTHLYDIVGLAATTKTHKYDVIGKVTTTKTHLYDVAGQVSTTKTHLYSILEDVTCCEKIHRYDVTNLIAQSPQTQTHKYDIVGLVSTTKTHKYNIDSALFPVSTTKTHKYDITGLVTTTKTHLYSVISSLSTTKTHKYTVLSTVSQTKTHKYSIIHAITQTRTHLYSLITSVSTTKTHIYSVINAVSTTKTHKYDVIGKVTTPKTHKYDVESALYPVSTTKTHKFIVQEATTPVSTTKTHKYGILISIHVTKTHKYSILEDVTCCEKIHRYDIISKITIPATKIHLYSIINKISATKTHRYDISTAVSTTKTHKYSLLTSASTTKTHLYNIIGKITRTHTHKWNAGGKVTKSKIHKYEVGSGISIAELGGSTQTLIKFPERIRIVDIISSIQNIAISNVEIVQPTVPPNTAISLIELEEFRVTKTASAKRLRLRTASQLVVPQIQDTIENKATAPYIAIEILEPEATSRMQLTGSILLQRSEQYPLRILSQTQIKQTEQTIIKVASTTTIEPHIKTRVASQSNLQLPYSFTRHLIKVQEIMNKEMANLYKTIIDALKNDDLSK